MSSSPALRLLHLLSTPLRRLAHLPFTPPQFADLPAVAVVPARMPSVELVPRSAAKEARLPMTFHGVWLWWCGERLAVLLENYGHSVAEQHIVEDTWGIHC